MDEYLTQLYYNPKRSGSFGGVERLYRDVKKEGKYDISRAQLKKWLMKQDTYTLHKQARRHYKRNRVIVGGIDELWQMDLADMQSHAKENDGYRYLLVCIDVFSKYVWVIPLKNKTGPALVTAFKEILESGRKPQKIQTDEGTESSMYCLHKTGSDVTNYLITGSDVITLISCRCTACFPTGSDVTNRK